MKARSGFPRPRPISAVLQPVSQVLSNFIKWIRGLNPSTPHPRTRPHGGNMISGFAPTRKPLPALQPRGCIYLLNLRGKGSEGNGIESVSGCNKLKSRLLVLPLWRPEWKRETEISVTKTCVDQSNSTSSMVRSNNVRASVEL